MKVVLLEILLLLMFKWGKKKKIQCAYVVDQSHCIIDRIHNRKSFWNANIYNRHKLLLWQSMILFLLKQGLIMFFKPMTVSAFYVMKMWIIFIIILSSVLYPTSLVYLQMIRSDASLNMPIRSWLAFILLKKKNCLVLWLLEMNSLFLLIFYFI